MFWKSQFLINYIGKTDIWTFILAKNKIFLFLFCSDKHNSVNPSYYVNWKFNSKLWKSRWYLWFCFQVSHSSHTSISFRSHALEFNVYEVSVNKFLFSSVKFIMASKIGKFNKWTHQESEILIRYADNVVAKFCAAGGKHMARSPLLGHHLLQQGRNSGLTVAYRRATSYSALYIFISYFVYKI